MKEQGDIIVLTGKEGILYIKNHVKYIEEQIRLEENKRNIKKKVKKQ